MLRSHKRETWLSYILLCSAIRSLPDFPTHDHWSSNPLSPNPLISTETEGAGVWNEILQAASCKVRSDAEQEILLNSCWLPCTAAGKYKPADWQWLAPASCIDCSNLRAIYLYCRKVSLEKGFSLTHLVILHNWELVFLFDLYLKPLASILEKLNDVNPYLPLPLSKPINSQKLDHLWTHHFHLSS